MLSTCRFAAALAAVWLFCIPDVAAQDGQPVTFSAGDSLVIVFDSTEGDIGTLYGDARVEAQDATLGAYRIRFLFEANEVEAFGLPSDTGLVGLPQFARGEETFEGRTLAYNLTTERGRVVEAGTELDEGFVRGDVVKVAQDSTIYVAEGLYTTCECKDDPSYSLRSSKMMVVEGDKVFTGPIQLFLFNIATPLWLPFGYLPATEGRRSGPLPPKYGEDQLGFYLRDWGYYWAISDYVDLQVLAGLWSRGSWQINPLFRYSRRYRYNGQVNFDLTYQRRGEPTDLEFQEQYVGNLAWTHSQEISPTERFNANVRLTSASYLFLNAERYDDRVRQTTSSSITFNKNWPRGGRNLTLKATQQQNFATGNATLKLPVLSFNQSTRTPFARENPPPGSDERWYEKIRVSYSGNASNNYAFDPLPDSTLAQRDSSLLDVSWLDALFSPEDYRQVTGINTPVDLQASHSVPVRATFRMTELPFTSRPFFLTLTPSFTYNEDWFSRTRHTFVEDSTVQSEFDPGFFALRQFNFSLQSNTTLYGTFPFRIGAFQGLRHVFQPSLSYTYHPDFGADTWGYTDTYTALGGNAVRYARAPGVQIGEQQSLSLNIDNTFQTKRVTVDTTGAETENVITLLNLGLNSNYNFAADSFKLGNLNFSARTSLFDRYDIQANATFSPYQLRDMPGGTGAQRPVDRYSWQDGFRLPRLTNLNLSVSTSFSSGRTGSGRTVGTPRAQPSAMPGIYPGEPLYDPNNPFGSPFFNTRLGYADFSIPWSLNFRFNYRLSNPLGDLNRTANLNTDFDFNLTPNWKVQGRTGYDLIDWEFVTTSLGLTRNLGCWEMSINWIPFGRSKSYSFDLHVKSGFLSELLRIRQPRAEIPARFGDVF